MPQYNEDTQFWIFKTNMTCIETIDIYNEKNKIKDVNIFCFPKKENIKKGDFIFILNDVKRGKYNKGFIKHYKAITDCKINKNHNIFRDTLLHKYFIKFDIEYEYNEIFNILKFKDNFSDYTPVKTPTMFNKLYTNNVELFNFKQLEFDLGIFLLNLILRRVKKKIKNQTLSETETETETETDDNSETETETDDNSETETETETDDNSETDHFLDNKKEKGDMIPVLIETCKKINNKINDIIKGKKDIIKSKKDIIKGKKDIIKSKKDIIKSKNDINPNLFMEHYLNCGCCNSIDNNNIGLKYLYLKNNKKIVKFNIVEFEDIEEQYESYINMQSYSYSVKTTTFNINFIKDNSSEYNNNILIYWSAK
jgi:hypothetical protein